MWLTGQSEVIRAVKGKKMNKKEKDLARVEEFRTRFESLSEDELRKKLAQGYLLKEAAVAIKQLLKEKDQDS
jgi:hypothetical protein